MGENTSSKSQFPEYYPEMINPTDEKLAFWQKFKPLHIDVQLETCFFTIDTSVNFIRTNVIL